MDRVPARWLFEGERFRCPPRRLGPASTQRRHPRRQRGLVADRRQARPRQRIHRDHDDQPRWLGSADDSAGRPKEPRVGLLVARRTLDRGLPSAGADDDFPGDRAAALCSRRHRACCLAAPALAASRIAGPGRGCRVGLSGSVWLIGQLAPPFRLGRSAPNRRLGTRARAKAPRRAFRASQGSPPECGESHARAKAASFRRAASQPATGR